MDTTKAPTNVYKAGEILKLYGHTWIKKFMILRNNTLEIFKNQPKKKSKKPEQSISLSTIYSMSTAIKNDGARSYFILIPHHSSGGYHLFATESVAELGPWVESLTLALDSVGKASENEKKKEMAAAPVVEVAEVKKDESEESESDSSEEKSEESENSEEDKKSDDVKEKNDKKEEEKESEDEESEDESEESESEEKDDDDDDESSEGEKKKKKKSESEESESEVEDEDESESDE